MVTMNATTATSRINATAAATIKAINPVPDKVDVDDADALALGLEHEASATAHVSP